VTSTTATSGYYPGKLMTYVAATDTWTDDVDIKIKDINGGVPSVQRYLGRYAGINSYGNPVYMIILSGGGGATLSIDVVTSIQCVDGEMLPNWTTLCIPGANICTTTTTSTAAPTTTSTTSTGGG